MTTDRREPCSTDCACLCHDGFGGAHPGQDCRERNAPDCSCSYVYVGLERTGSRNWSYHCPVHGTGTDWYHEKLRNDPQWQRWSYPTPSDLRAAGLSPRRPRRHGTGVDDR